VDIAGATGASLQLGPDDVGHRLRVLVTATNGAGSDTATSATGPLVQALAPQNVDAPALSGTLVDGQTLTADDGDWTGTGPIAHFYQWQRCNAQGTSCADITGATGSTYDLTAADAGQTLRVVVSGTNSAGSDSAASPASGLVHGIAPNNTSAPTVSGAGSGTLRDGQTMTAGNGAWTGTSPIQHAYQWQRCDAQGTSCVNISGATGSGYDLTGADIGHTVRVVVTATNVEGSQPAISSVSALIHGIAPANTVAPGVAGTTRSGQTMTADGGAWSGTGPVVRSYQWQRCDAQGANCQDIAGETGSSYDLTGADIGHTVRVIVTGTNNEGSDSAPSQRSAVVTAASAPPPPTPPAPKPPVATPPSSPAPAVDLSSLPGSLLGANSCQQASGARVLNFKVPGFGRLRIRVAPNGVVTGGQPLLAQALVTPKAARKLKKTLRQVSYSLGSRKLGAKRKAPYALKITPALLSAARRQQLAVQVVPKKGKPRVSVVDLSSEPCPDLFTVVHRPGARGSLLTMRVDTRRQLRSVVFKAPAKLLAAKGAKGSAGLLKLVSAGQPARNLKLTFPKKKSRVTSLIAAAGGPQVTVKGGTVTVSGLPSGTGIVQLRLKGRGIKKTPKATLRASFQTDSGSRALKQKLGVKRK
jgi:hypothetical protein